MRLLKFFAVFSVMVISGSALFVSNLKAEEAVVYGVYNPLYMGLPNEQIVRDLYINLGIDDGVQVGSKLSIFRKVPTYDLSSNKLYKDLMVPVGTVRVIHSEPGASIARIETAVPTETSPIITPSLVMVGDYVKSN